MDALAKIEHQKKKVREISMKIKSLKKAFKEFNQLKINLAAKGIHEYWLYERLTAAQLKPLLKLCFRKKTGGQHVGGGHLSKTKTVMLQALSFIPHTRECVDAMYLNAQNDLSEREEEFEREREKLRELWGPTNEQNEAQDEHTFLIDSSTAVVDKLVLTNN